MPKTVNLPKIEPPTPPPLNWVEKDGMQCLTNEEAVQLYEYLVLMDAHTKKLQLQISILQGGTD